jgi:hypothetical protein
MAVKTLEEVIASLSGTEKELFEKTLKDTPELREGWLRQDDYSRKLNELKSKEAEYQTAVDYKTRMEPWAEEAYERLHSLEEAGVLAPDGEVLWVDKEAELRQQIAAAEARALAGGGDMKPEEIRASVEQIAKDIGIPLTAEERKALYESEAKRAAEAAVEAKLNAATSDFNTKTIPLTMGMAAAMAISAVRYEKETGKEFTDEDHQKVVSLLREENGYDPRKAMAEYIKPIVAEKNSAAEIERRAQERANEILKERGGLPGAGGEPYIPQPREKGNLERMLERSKDGATDFESLIQQQTVKAAQELRTEGKA